MKLDFIQKEIENFSIFKTKKIEEQNRIIENLDKKIAEADIVMGEALKSDNSDKYKATKRAQEEDKLDKLFAIAKLKKLEDLQPYDEGIANALLECLELSQNQAELEHLESLQKILADIASLGEKAKEATSTYENLAALIAQNCGTSYKPLFIHVVGRKIQGIGNHANIREYLDPDVVIKKDGCFISGQHVRDREVYEFNNKVNKDADQEYQKWAAEKMKKDPLWYPKPRNPRIGDDVWYEGTPKDPRILNARYMTAEKMFGDLEVRKKEKAKARKAREAVLKEIISKRHIWD